jgi:hypothetical protein
VVQAIRTIPLLNDAGGHDADLVGHGKGFVLIVGDQHRGNVLALENVTHFERQALAQTDIEIGERFVEEQQLRLWRQRSGQRHPLLLPSREFMRVFAALASEANRGQQARRRGSDARSAARPARPKPTFAATVRCGKARSPEKPCRSARCSGGSRQPARLTVRALHANLAGSNVLKPAMQRNSVVLPQARGSEQAGYAAGFDTETDAIDDGMRAVALDDSFEFEMGHRMSGHGTGSGQRHLPAAPGSVRRRQSSSTAIQHLSIIILIYARES